MILFFFLLARIIGEINLNLEFAQATHVLNGVCASACVRVRVCGCRCELTVHAHTLTYISISRPWRPLIVVAAVVCFGFCFCTPRASIEVWPTPTSTFVKIVGISKRFEFNRRVQQQEQQRERAQRQPDDVPDDEQDSRVGNEKEEDGGLRFACHAALQTTNWTTQSASILSCPCLPHGTATPAHAPASAPKPHKSIFI